MRITIGGALLFAGAGGIAVVGPLKSVSPSIVTEQISGLQQSITWVGSYFKSGQPVETAPISIPTPEVHTEAAPVAPVAAVPVEAPQPAAPVENTAPVVEAAAPAPVVKAAARRHRRHRVAAAAAPAAAATAEPVKKPSRRASKKAAAKAGGSDMIGLYVALQLKSGREVKGVLKEKSDTQYTIELPGMGPFQYPISNVLGIKPVE